MATPFRPRAEDETPDIRDNANASLAQGQQQVAAQAQPEEESASVQQQQWNLNETKRRAYEQQVREAEARRAQDGISSTAWKSAAGKLKGPDKDYAVAAAKQAAADEDLLAESQIRIEQDRINAQREAERMEATARAQETRQHAARGGETVTDPVTGRSSIATHEDGSPKFKPGPLPGTTPQEQLTAEAALALVPGIGGFVTGDKPLNQTTELVQPMQDDRGNAAMVPLEQKTDKDTGEIYSETKDAYGQPQRVTLGQDPLVPKLNELDQKIAARQIERDYLDIQEQQIAPRYQATEDSYLKIKTDYDKAPPFIQVDGKWIEAPQGEIPFDPAKRKQWLQTQFPADPQKLAAFQRERAMLEPQWRSAKKRYEAEKPKWDNLQKQKEALKLDQDKLRLSKKRLELGLPEEDGGTANIILKSEDGTFTDDETAVAEYLKSLPTDERMRLERGIAPSTQPPTSEADSSTATPLIPQDDPARAALFASTFGGIVAPEALTVKKTSDKLSHLYRDGTYIGKLGVDAGGKTPHIIVESAFAPADILAQVTFGNTSGVDVYLADPKGLIDPEKEAAWIASVSQATRAAPDPAEAAEALGASPQQIVAKVKAGELSVKRGEAMMRDLWGGSFKAEDPAAKGMFEKWLHEEASPETRKAWFKAQADRSTAAKNDIMQTYLDAWQVRNQWKPGVTLSQRLAHEKALKLTPRTSEQIAGMADAFAVTAIQSVAMLSQLLTPVVAPVNAVINPGDNSKWAEAVGRATANDTRMLQRTATRYTTPEGKQAFKERDSILGEIEQVVRAQDIFPGGRDNPEWKAEMDAVIRKATDNADKIHGWNREDGWEITREDIDPATNEDLRNLIDNYALTGNRDMLVAFMGAQLEDHGTRQTAKYALDLAAGRNKYVAAFVQGTHASLYETATEVASTALTMGAGKILYGAGKAATVAKAAGQMAKLEQAAAAGSRLAKFRLAMHGVKAGMVPDTLANPATRLGKLGNTASKVGKFALGAGVTGAAEEGFMGLARPDATPANILHDALIGMVMEPLLGGIMAAPAIGIGSALDKAKVSRSVAKFADAYNREFNGSEGFVPLTPQKAQAAMALFDGVNLNAAAQRLTESAASLKAAVEAAAAPTAGPAEVQAMHAAQAAHRETLDSISESVFSRLEAVQHVESVQKEDRPLAYAIAKVAAGRADLVTPQERAAAAGALTPAGAPVFATNANGIDILTDEGRAHAMTRFPGVGMLIQTAESERMFGEQIAADAAAANGQAAPQVAPAATADKVSDIENIPRVPVTPEQQQQAAQITEQVIQQVAAEAPAIAARLTRGAATVRVSGGVTASVSADGTTRIQIIEDDIAQSLAAGMAPEQVAARVKDNIILHETIHTIQFQVAENQQRAAGTEGDPATLTQQFYQGLHTHMAAESPQMLENGRALYAENDDGTAPSWDTLPEWAQAAEVVRMLAEAKLAGRTTDVSRLLSGASPTLLEKLAQIVRDMIAAITTGENIPETVKQHVDTLTDLYNELLNATPDPNASSPNPADNPSQPAPGQTGAGNRPAPQGNGNRPADSNGGTQPPPGDDTGTPPQSAEQQARVKATEIVRKEYDKTLEAQPLYKKDPELLDALRITALEAVEAAMEDMPNAARIAKEMFGSFRQDPDIQSRVADMVLEKRSKGREYRRTKQRLVDAAAANVIDGIPMLKAMDRENLRFEGPPRTFGLIVKKARLAKKDPDIKLTPDEQEIYDKYTASGYEGMPKMSDFPGGGKNAVIRSIIKTFIRPPGEGLAPDEMQDYEELAPHLKGQSVMEAFAKAIQNYAWDRASLSNIEDPDADIADDQIEAALAKSTKENLREKWSKVTGFKFGISPQAYEDEFLKLAAANDFETNEEGDLVDPFNSPMLPEDRTALEAEAVRIVNERNAPKPKVETREALDKVETEGSTATLNPRVEGLEGQSVSRGDLSGKTQPLSTADLQAIQRNGAGITAPPTDGPLKQAVDAFVAKAQAIMPMFQGNKVQMAKYVASAILRYWSKAQREAVTTFYDMFAGGGAWGLVLADTFFPNVKKFVINEFDTARSIKVREQMVNGHRFAEVIQKDDTQKIIKGILQDYYARSKGVTWGGIYLQFEKWAEQNAEKFDDTTIAIIKMLADDSTLGAPTSWGNLQEEIGKELDGRPVMQRRGPNADEVTKWFLGRHAKWAETIHQTYRRMRDRGVDFTFRNGDAYTMDVDSGRHVFVTADPPYFATTGYDDSIVGPGMYAATRNLMRRLTGQDNNIAYTDEAWWVKDSINEKITDADLVEGAEIATQIANTLDFMVVAGKIESRYETLGLHNPAGSPVAPGRTANPDGNASRPDGGNLQQEGRGPDGRGATGDVAPGPVAEAGLQPTGDEGRLGSAPVTGMNGRPAIRTTDGRTLEAPGAVLMSAPAWHGTPHKVDKFTTEKIGTGEGAQAYGWGLYFAESKGVADEYRTSLSRDITTSYKGEKGLFPSEVDVRGGLANLTDNEIIASIQKYGGALERARTADEKAEIAAKWASLYVVPDEVAQRVKEVAKTYDPKNETSQAGNLYRVTLKVEDDDLLDWDKPLSEQSEKVKSALQNTAAKELLDPKYNGISRFTGADALDYVKAQEMTPADASIQLRKAGIRGIRYLDGNSRGLTGVKLSWKSAADQAKWGTDMALDFADRALAKHSNDAKKAIRELLAEYRQSGNPSAADAAYALEAGAIISKPNASYNYVIFDEADIEITEENGTPVSAQALMSPAPSIAERMESDFGPLTPDNAFASWAASTTEPGIIYGYRGENGNGQADNGFGASEGVGLYLARDEKDTDFFGKARKVAFPQPKRPLIVDQDGRGDPIPLLQEYDEETWDHIWSHKPSPQDSDWIKAHVLAAKKLGMTQENSEGWDTKLPRALTDILLSMGYDAVYVRSGGMQWVNILAKPGQRFNRGTRSAAGTALYSAPAQNPGAQYRYLKDKEAKAGLTPAEQQALLRAEQAMGQSFAIDMDDPALKARRGSVTPSFQPQLNLERQHPITGQQLALFSAPAEEWTGEANFGELKELEMTDWPFSATYQGREVEVLGPAADLDPNVLKGILPPDTTPDRFRWWRIQTKEGKQANVSVHSLSKHGKPLIPAPKNPKGVNKIPIRNLYSAPAQRDAAYLSAVEAGDMDTAQRMVDEAAKKAGIAPFSVFGFEAIISKNTRPEEKPWRVTFFENENLEDGGLGHFQLDNKDQRTVIEKGQTVDIESRFDPVTRDAQGNVIPLSQRFNPQSDSMLYSAPAQPNAEAALDDALKGMDPIYRKVLQASQRTPTPTPQDLAAEFKLPEKAIRNIIATARTRIQAFSRTRSPQGLQPATTPDGQIKGGRPDLGYSTVPALAAVDQIRNQEGLPLSRSNQEIREAAQKIVARPDAVEHLIAAFSENRVSPEETAAANSILLAAGLKGIQSPRLTELALLYREVGSKWSEEGRARIDIHRTPAERHALILANVLTAPDKRTQKAWKDAKTADQKAAVLEAWNARVKGIKDSLKARGVDLDAAMQRLDEQRATVQAAESEASATHQKLVDALTADVERLKGELAKATGEAARNAAQAQVDAAQQKAEQAAALDPARSIQLELEKLSKPERAAIEALRDGATWEQAASLSFMKVPEVKRTFDKFADALDDAGMKAILLAEEIMLAKEARLNAPAANAMSREDRAKQAAAAIRKALGYDRTMIDRRSMGTTKPARTGKGKQAPAKPEPGMMSDAQFQAYIDNPQTWRPLWQAESTLTGETISFEDWINKPETRAKKARQERMFRQPVSTFTGELDMNDPLSVKRAYDALNIHSASWFDKAVDFWRMSILSGPQTGIVNFGGNIAHSLYNLGPRRILEAGVNDALGIIGMGSKDAATLGELRVMAKQIHKALSHAGSSMIRSWNANNRVVESEVLALGLQEEFSGVGADYIPRALGGTLGGIMHAISFRHMTASDEMLKSFHSHMEVAAQAYRMAKAEGLKGDAMETRITELMEYGSPAWRKAYTAAEWVTFQTPVDKTSPQALAFLDRAAGAIRRMTQTDTGKTKEIINAKGKKVTVPIYKPNAFAFFFPFINTPLNIFKIGIEMSPMGAFFSVVDAARALKVRVDNKHLTPAAAKAEAAELYNKARLVKDLTNQIIGAGMFWALGALIKPDDDDEEIPFITGSVDWKRTSRGDRQVRERVMPAYSIRIGDSIFSYQRIEPFGTALGLLVDLRLAVDKNGISDAALGEFMTTAINQLDNKTYMQGVSDLFNAIHDPERFGSRLASSVVTGFVPNLIRQPIREADPYIRDTKVRNDEGFVEAVTKRIGYSLAPGYAPIAMDVWGNPLRRNPGEQIGGNFITDTLLRVFDPTNLRTGSQPDPIDVYLFNWNNSVATPKERFNIEEIKRDLQITRNGVTTRVTISPEDHLAANRNAGQAARAMLGDDWNPRNPTPEGVERIKETLRRFQDRERDRLRNKYAATLTK